MNEVNFSNPRLSNQHDQAAINPSQLKGMNSLRNLDITKIASLGKKILPLEISENQFEEKPFKHSVELMSVHNDKNIDKTAKNLLLQDLIPEEDELENEILKLEKLSKASKKSIDFEQSALIINKEVSQAEQTETKVNELASAIIPVGLDEEEQALRPFLEDENEVMKLDDTLQFELGKMTINMEEVNQAKAAIQATGAYALLLRDEMILIKDLDDITPFHFALLKEMHKNKEITEIHLGSSGDKIILKVSDNCKAKYELNMRIRGADGLWKTVEAIDILSAEDVQDQLKNLAIILNYLMHLLLSRQEDKKAVMAKELSIKTPYLALTKTHVIVLSSKLSKRVGNDTKIHQTQLKVQSYFAPRLEKLMKRFMEKDKELTMEKREHIDDDNLKREINRKELARGN